MALGITEVLKNENRLKIFQLLLKEPKITLSEISKKLGISQSAVTQHINKMEEAGVIRSEYQPAEKGGVTKKLSLTFRGIFEQMSEQADVILTEREYEVLDDTVLNDKSRKAWLDYFSNLEKQINEGVDPAIALSFLGFGAIIKIQKTSTSKELKAIQDKFLKGMIG